MRPFFLDPLGGSNPTSKKKFYDFASYLVTQITMSFVTIPFLTLTLRDSLNAWASLYYYGLIWTLGALAFFLSPGRQILKKQLESRTGKARVQMARSVSTESITSMEPILGISSNPQQDVNEAMEEIKAEIEAKRKEIARKKA